MTTFHVSSGSGRCGSARTHADGQTRGEISARDRLDPLLAIGRVRRGTADDEAIAGVAADRRAQGNTLVLIQYGRQNSEPMGGHLKALTSCGSDKVISDGRSRAANHSLDLIMRMTSDANAASVGDSNSLLLDFCARVPEELVASVEEILARPAAGQEDMLEDLDDYTTQIDAASRQRADLDVHLAEMILRTCRTLLEEDWAHLDPAQQSLVRLACVYYLDSDDADGDLESPFGFEDDALILNLVLEFIGRSELRVRA